MQTGDLSKTRRFKKIVGPLLLTLFLAGLFADVPASSESHVWIVDPYPAVGDYNTIWEAVLFASRGDTIHVNPGTYRESVEVAIPLTVEGSPEGDSIVETKRDYGFKLTPAAAGATIRNFTVHCSSHRQRGILLDQAREVTIANNAISACEAGVLLDQATENQVLENVLSDSAFGIKLDRSSKNQILHNTGFGNFHAINLWQSVHNEIAQNEFAENSVGVELDESDENTIKGNILKQNNCGICFWRADRNSLRSNEARENGTGIGLGESMNNALSYNHVRGNWGEGISLGNSSDNTIEFNDIQNARGQGLVIGGRSEGNVVQKNNIDYNWLRGLVNWTDPEFTIDARQNWWGDPSGPYQWERNPSGKGNEIDDRVLFRPWLEEPVSIPQQEGN